MFFKILCNRSDIKKVNDDIKKKRRGPYKQYNLYGSTKNIPARTMYTWRKKKYFHTYVDF